ncbi:MAG: hypothetical protein QNJ36_10070 [Calothrix sp. MO_167.B42]|nr:hypothetical protein [Calothrix sp. MO_167.B42]
MSFPQAGTDGYAMPWYYNPMAIKIVVNTSVFISALIGSKSPSRELI